MKPENSLDYAQKPQQNCTFMNSAFETLANAKHNGMNKTV